MSLKVCVACGRLQGFNPENAQKQLNKIEEEQFRDNTTSRNPNIRADMLGDEGEEEEGEEDGEGGDEEGEEDD